MVYLPVAAALLAFAFSANAQSSTATATATTLTTSTASSSRSSITAGPSSTVISVFGPATNLFIDGYDGSLIDVQNGLTTFAYSCQTDVSTAGVCSLVGSVTATAGPSDYRVTYSVSTDGAVGTLTATCKITDHTTGTCRETLYISEPALSTKATLTQTFGAEDVVSVSITLTAGNLAALTGPGTATTNTATSNVAAPTGAYNYMGAGAAGLAALLLI